MQLLAVGKTTTLQVVPYNGESGLLTNVPQPLAHHTTILSSVTQLDAFPKQVMVTSYDKTLSVVKSVEDNAFEKVVQFKAHNEEVMCSTELIEGRVATGGFDCCMKIWDLNTATEGDSTQPLLTISTEDSACFRIKYDKVKNRLFMLSADKFVRAYDATTGKITQKISGHSDRVRDLHFNNESQILTTVGDDNRVHIWDLRAMKLAHRLTGTTKQTMGVTACGDDTLVVSGITGELKIFDLRNVENPIIIENAHDKVISGLHTIDSSTFVSIGGSDGMLNVWNTSGVATGYVSIGEVMIGVCALH